MIFSPCETERDVISDCPHISSNFQAILLTSMNLYSIQFVFFLFCYVAFLSPNKASRSNCEFSKNSPIRNRWTFFCWLSSYCYTWTRRVQVHKTGNSFCMMFTSHTFCWLRLCLITNETTFIWEWWKHILFTLSFTGWTGAAVATSESDSRGVWKCQDSQKRQLIEIRKLIEAIADRWLHNFRLIFNRFLSPPFTGKIHSNQFRCFRLHFWC